MTGDLPIAHLVTEPVPDAQFHRHDGPAVRLFPWLLGRPGTLRAHYGGESSATVSGDGSLSAQPRSWSPVLVRAGIDISAVVKHRGVMRHGCRSGCPSSTGVPTNSGVPA